MSNGKISALLADYERGALTRGEFEFEIWILIVPLAGDDAEHLHTLPLAVRNFVASRYMEWEVNNGTFSQAAYNLPNWFEPAAVGYEALGLKAAASLIRRAHRVLLSGSSDFTRESDMPIEDLFNEFEISPLYNLDWLEPDIGWDAEEKRVAYLMKNVEAFIGLA